MLNILLPLDGSELAEGAIAHAHAISSALPAKVTLLRVVRPAEFRSKDAFSRIDWRLRKQQAQSYLQGVAVIFETANIPCELRVEEGQPAEVIMTTAQELGVNLLVMSTHGRGAAIDFPRGGVAGKVLSTFGASVCLVGARAVPIRESKALYRRLLVPVDGSPESECALRVAMSLAESLDAQLSVVCIGDTVEVPSIVAGDEKAQSMCRALTEMTQRAAEQKLVELRARIPGRLRLTTAVMLTERTTNPIVEIARRFSPDLLVTSMAMTDRAGEPYASSSRIASAVELGPMLVLSPNGIGDAFCELSDTEPPDARTADVS
jgi:nucleotide-binding universal stress UspA family protein